MNKSYVSYALYYTPSDTLLREYPYSNRKVKKVKKLKLSENPYFVINRTNAYIVTMSFFCTDKNSFDAENLTYTIKESGKNNIVDRKYKHVHIDEDGDESEVFARDNHKMKLRLVVAFKSDETKDIIVHDRNADDPEEDIHVEMQKYDLKFEFTDEADLKIMETRKESDMNFITENAAQIFGKKVSGDNIQKNFNAKFKEEENYKTKEKYMGLTAVVMFPVQGTPKEHARKT